MGLRGVMGREDRRRPATVGLRDEMGMEGARAEGAWTGCHWLLVIPGTVPADSHTASVKGAGGKTAPGEVGGVEDCCRVSHGHSRDFMGVPVTCINLSAVVGDDNSGSFVGDMTAAAASVTGKLGGGVTGFTGEVKAETVRHSLGLAMVLMGVLQF